MKKRILLIISIVLLAFIAFIFVVQSTLYELKPDESIGYHRILIDSMKIDDKSNLYWFKYNTGVYGYVGDYLSINESSHQIDSATAIIKSSYISEIDTVRNDSILINLSKIEYELINKTKHKIIFRTPKSYWDVNKPALLINLDSTMK